MKVALIGSVSSSWHTLRGLIAGGVEVVCVLGLDESHAARVSDYRSLRELAESAGIPFRSFDKVAGEGVAGFLRPHAPDLLFAVGLSQLIPKWLLTLAPAGAVGFHPTPLPKGRGRAPVAWTILLDQPAAANLFFLTDEPDAGDIIDQRPVEVRPDDYARDLIDRTNEVLEAMVLDLAPAIRSGRLPRRPQDHSGATWYRRRVPEDGLIDWRDSADEIYRLVRACSHPYPGAFTHWGEARLVVWRARPHPAEDHHGTVGQILRIGDGPALLVQCGRGLLWLTDLRLDGGRGTDPGPFREGLRLGWDVRARLEEMQTRLRRLERRIRGQETEGVT